MATRNCSEAVDGSARAKSHVIVIEVLSMIALFKKLLTPDYALSSGNCD